MRLIKYIKIATILLLSFVTLTANADSDYQLQKHYEDENFEFTYEKEKYANIDKVFSKDHNRFFLGGLGREGFNYYGNVIIEASVLSDIYNLSDAEIEFYSGEFNSGWVKLSYIIRYFLGIAALISMLLLFYVLSKSLFLTARDGKAFGNDYKFIFTIIGLLATSLIGWDILETDIDKPTITEKFIYSAFGSNFKLVDDLIETLNEEEKIATPSVKIPRSFIYKSDINNLIDSMIEEKSARSGETKIDYNFVRDAKYFKVVLDGVQAKLAMKISIDKELIKQQKFLGNDFSDFQELKVQKSFEFIINKANKITDNVMKNDPDSWFTDNKNFDYLTETCSDYENIELTNVSAKSLHSYLKAASKCLSKEFVKRMAKIPSYDYEKIITGTHGLRNHTVQLCVAPTTTILNRPIDKIKKSDLKQCVATYCATDDSSSTYACSVATKLLLKVEEREKNLNAGYFKSLLLEPFKSIMKIDTSSSKQSINSVNMVQEESDFKKKNDYKITIDSKSYDHFNFETYQDFMSDKGNNIIENFSFQNISSDMNVMQMLTGTDGVLGWTRFDTCFKSPMRISDGFVCDTAYAEMNTLSDTMIATSISLYLSSALLNPITKSKKKGRRAAIGKGKSVAKELKDSAKSGNLVMSKGTGLVAIGMIGALVDDTGLDHFIGINENISENAPEMAAIIIGLSLAESSTGFDLVGIVAYLLMLAGVIIGYVVPLSAYVFIAAMIATVIIKIFETVIMVPLCILMAIIPSKNDRSEYLTKGFQYLLSGLLKPIYVFLGVIISVFMIQYVVPSLDLLSIVDMFTIEGSASAFLMSFISLFAVIYLMIKINAFVYEMSDEAQVSSMNMIYDSIEMKSNEKADDGEQKAKQVGDKLKSQMR